MAACIKGGVLFYFSLLRRVRWFRNMRNNCVFPGLHEESVYLDTCDTGNHATLYRRDVHVFFCLSVIQFVLFSFDVGRVVIKLSGKCPNTQH